MGRYSLKEADPALYEQILQEQRELRGTYASRVTMARLCPYCNHKLEVLCRGSHAQTVMRKYSSLRFRSGEQERLMNIIGRTTEN